MKKLFTMRSGLVASVTGLALLGATLPVTVSASAASKVTNITVWGSGGDQSQEQNAIQLAVSKFNTKYAGKYHASLSFVPNISTVQETVSASGTATVMEGDGPTLPYLAYSGKLTPLGNAVAAANIANQSAYVKAQNTYKGKLYGMSVINGTLTLYGNKKLLNAAGITACTGATTATCYPSSWSKAWTAQQFGQVLTALKNTPSVASLDNGYVWSANLAYGGEYSTYGFLPIINSAGSAVIANNSANPLKSTKVYNAISQFLNWLPWCDPTGGSATTGGTGGAFAAGNLALHWGGHWQYPGFSTGDVSSAANGGKSNLVTIPLPNFGSGAKDGAGSNNWEIGASASKAQLVAAGAFLNILTTPSFINLYTGGNGETVTSGGVTVPKYGDGAVPASPAALKLNPEYAPGGILYQAGVAETKACAPGVINANCFAVPRPVTPAYPAITSAISTMFNSLFATAQSVSVNETSLSTAVSLSTIQSQVQQAVDAINSNYQQYNNYK